MLAKKLNAKSHIPFGPFLIIATIIVKLFGASVVTWYRRKFLLY
jgi:prepilin signal peptidase PulO-like enzyme (type II secretory pathway)